jgi:hypothetical protein
LTLEAFYINALQYGPQTQWNADGAEISQTWFEGGTGWDLFFGGCAHDLTESRSLRNGARHGPERWWSGGLVYQEEYFAEGQRHGITREWNGRRLEPGFPKFFIRDVETDELAYRRALVLDPSLPPYRRRDDRPQRHLGFPREGLLAFSHPPATEAELMDLAEEAGGAALARLIEISHTILPSLDAAASSLRALAAWGFSKLPPRELAARTMVRNVERILDDPLPATADAANELHQCVATLQVWDIIDLCDLDLQDVETNLRLAAQAVARRDAILVGA